MRRFQKLTDSKLAVCLRSLALVLAAVVLWTGATGLGFANILPTDREPLVIETGSGPVEFTVELALTPANRSTGLMHRETMPAAHGMLFRFERTRQVQMWMKNTPLSLDMVFINEAGEVAGIAAGTTPFSEAIISSPGPVRYVLELNAGTAARAGIRPGDRVRHRVVGAYAE